MMSRTYLLFAALAGLTLSAGAADIAKGGKPAAYVDLGGSTNATVVYSAKELTNWVARISGAALPIEGGAKASTVICLGTPETSPAIADFAKKHADDFAKLDGNDGFIIGEEGGLLGLGSKRIYIAGSIPRGVRNGVYRFLEKNSDIIWVRQLHGTDGGFGTVWTDNPNMKNSIDYFVDVPRLIGRSWTSVGAEQENWQQRLLNNGIRGRDNDIGFSTYMLVEKYGKTDPDVFPLVDGKRQIWHDCQLCYMNPKTLDLVEKEGLEFLKKNKINPTSVGIGLGDNWSVCQCELCMKPIKGDDGQLVQPTAKNFRSTQFAYFNMELYKRFKKYYPNLRPCLAPAYIWTAEVPAIKYPDGGSMYCPYIKNHKKPVFDDDVNAVWHDKAERFKAAGMGFTGLYEYYLCTTTPHFYHAVMDVMKQDLNYYLPELKYVYLDVPYNDNQLKEDEAKRGWGGYGTCNFCYDVSAIEFWVASRLMWNPDTDVKEARREFCRRAYHGAADIMIEYYEKMADNYNNDPAGCFWNDEPIAACKHYVVEKKLQAFVRDTLAKAEAAATDPRSKELIQRHAMRILPLIEQAEKAPKTVSLTVPQAGEAPASADPSDKYWRESVALAPLAPIGKPNVAPDGKTAIYVRHDCHNLYILMDMTNAGWLKSYEGFVKSGKIGDKADRSGTFDWCNCVEMFIDGDFGPKGSYYHLAFSPDERTHNGQGPTDLDKAMKWNVKMSSKEGGVRALVTLPLEDIGIDISKGNKIHCNFTVNGSSWNGGQHHSPTSFQTLVLQMQ